MSDTWQLGQKVRYADRLVRTYVVGRKVWQRRGDKWIPAEPGVGVLVGLRTISDGEVSYWDERPEYVPTKRYRAALIAVDLRRKPVLAFLEDVEAAP